MPNITFDAAAEKLGIKRSAFEKIVRSGKEIPFLKEKNKLVVNEQELINWIEIRKSRKVELTKDDFLHAIKFALKINYAEHTRADFGTSRQRPFMQAVENWTQGVLAEIALQKFIMAKFNTELQLELRIFEDAIVGQDIVAIKRGKTISPPRIRISVKSGKSNGMVLIVPINEGESTERRSQYYVFVRVIFPVDVFARFYRSSPEFHDMLDTIPDFEPVEAYIVGYCKYEELERRSVPEAGIDDEKFCKVSGELKNSDTDWKTFIDLV